MVENFRNPYRTPESFFSRFKMKGFPKTGFILACLSVLFSVWYLALDATYWLKAGFSYDTGNASEITVAIRRVFYILPKFGLIGGLVSLFKVQKYSISIYLASWAVSMIHTVMFYAGKLVAFSSGEDLHRLIVHHLIPHGFYLVIIFMLIRYEAEKKRI